MPAWLISFYELPTLARWSFHAPPFRQDNIEYKTNRIVIFLRGALPPPDLGKFLMSGTTGKPYIWFSKGTILSFCH
jgi:hypothetical protein